MTETKRCTGCGETKPLDAFRRDRSKKQGRCSRCRECDRQYERARRPKSTAPHHTYPLLKDRAWVEQQYSREFRSIAEIAAMVGCSYSTAHAAIAAHGLPAIPYGVRRALRARLEAQREGVGA